MQTTVSVPELKKAVTAAKRACPRASSRSTYAMPMLRGVRLTADAGTLTVEASDLDVTVRRTLVADVGSAGAVVVPAAELAKLLKGKGAMSLADEGETLRVVNGLTSSLRTLPLEEWPNVTTVDGPGVDVDLGAAAEVASFASTDDTRPILTGVLFSGSDIVGTDSYRLALHRVDGAAFPTALVPARAILEAARAGDRATFHFGPEHVRIVVGTTTVTARLIEGTFPQYDKLVPADPPVSLTVDRSAFVALVDGLRPMCADATPLRLTVEDGTLTARSAVQDVSEASGSMPAKVTGEFPSVVAFNPGFLLDVATTITGPELVLRLVDGMKPALVTEHRPGAVAIRLLMPVRVS